VASSQDDSGQRHRSARHWTHGECEAAGADDLDRTRQELDDGIRSLLHQYGLRCTTTRLAVLAALGAHRDSGHLSAAQIHRQLVDDGREVDLATV